MQHSGSAPGLGVGQGSPSHMLLKPRQSPLPLGCLLVQGTQLPQFTSLHLNLEFDFALCCCPIGYYQGHWDGPITLPEFFLGQDQYLILPKVQRPPECPGIPLSTCTSSLGSLHKAASSPTSGSTFCSMIKISAPPWGSQSFEPNPQGKGHHGRLPTCQGCTHPMSGHLPSCWPP